MTALEIYIKLNVLEERANFQNATILKFLEKNAPKHSTDTSLTTASNAQVCHLALEIWNVQ